MEAEKTGRCRGQRATRRTFLTGAAAALAGIFGTRLLRQPARADAAAIASPIPRLSERLSLMSGQLAHTSFQPLVNDHFQFSLAEGAAVALRLEQVSLDSTGEGTRVYSFSLVFRGPSGKPLEQGMFRVTHPSIEPMDLFVVPVGEEGGERIYQAVFSYLLEDTA